MDEPARPAPEAAGAGEAAPDATTLLRGHVRFVLVRPLQSGNVGSVARAMKNMGLTDLAVVAPPALDIDRARWMAPGAASILDAARYVGSVAAAVADCTVVYATTARGRHNRWPAFDTPGFARAAFDHLEASPGRVAVLFGPEDRGLANDELVHAHALLHIPTDEHASLNLAQASLLVAAALFGEARTRGHVARPAGEGRRGGPARGAAPGPTRPHVPAPIGAQDPLIDEWMGTLALTNYLDGHEPLLVEGTLRRIVGRAALDHQELAVLRGMLRKFRWHMERGGKARSDG